MLPVCNIFSGLHYSSENPKDWTALSSWLKFSARLHDCSSLMICQHETCSFQHTCSLCVNRWVLRLLLGEDDSWSCTWQGSLCPVCWIHFSYFTWGTCTDLLSYVIHCLLCLDSFSWLLYNLHMLPDTYFSQSETESWHLLFKSSFHLHQY